MTRLRLEIEVGLGSEAQARDVLAAISPDNEGHVYAVRKGDVLTLRASAETPLSLLHTVEDLMPCMSVAAQVGSMGRDRPVP